MEAVQDEENELLGTESSNNPQSGPLKRLWNFALDHFKRNYTRLEKITNRLFVLMILVAIISYPFVVNQETRMLYFAKKWIDNHADPTVDPCQDFYMFSCGKALQGYTVPALRKLNLRTYIDVKDMLEAPPGRNNTKAFEQARQFYATCILSATNDDPEPHSRLNSSKNISSVQDYQAEEIYTILNDGLIREWPMLHGADWTESKSKNLLLEIIASGFSEVLNINLMFVGHTAKYLLVVSIGNPGLSEDYPAGTSNNRNEHILPYVEGMFKTVALLNKQSDGLNSTVRNDIENIIKLERDIAKIRGTKSCTGFDKDFNSIQLVSLPVANILVHNLGFPLEDLIAKIPVPPGVMSDELTGLHCIEELLELFDLIQSTERRTVINYFIWRYVLKSLPFMGPSFQKIWTGIHHLVPGYKGSLQPLGWIECVDLVTTWFHFPVMHAYIHQQDYLPDKTMVENMTKYAKAAFSQIISDQSWVSDDFKPILLDKLTQMEYNIGYPSFIFDGGALDKDYESLYLDEKSYFLNRKILRKFYFLRNARLSFARDLSSWNTTKLLMGSGGHNALTNSIEIPLSILRFPVFNQASPMYLNFAQLGFVISHEIAHGFSINAPFILWPKNERLEMFKKSACFVEHYGKFTIPLLEENVDGMRTLEENLCDNIGLRVALLAYKLWKTDHPNVEEREIPGVNFTILQTFYLAYSQMWCETDRRETSESYLLRDVHSPHMYRVQGVIQNNAEFGDAFSCPVGSPMNPASKCKIWE